MRKVRLLLVGCVVLLLARPVGAAQVEATGTAAILAGNVASARQQALVNAQRNAVEQGVGLLVDSETVAENYQVIKDQILTSSQGFVTEYLVLKEGKTSDGQSYEVTIRAEVQEALLEDRLTALRILHKKMGNKRVMVVYGSDNQHALPRDHGASITALQTIRDALNEAGFRVFNEAATAQVYEQIERAGRVDRPVDDIIAMALDQQADILVRFGNVGGKRGAQGGMFSAAYSTIRISVFDVNTGRQIADTQVEGKQLLRSNAGPYDWEKGLADASEQASREAANEAINKIADYYARVGDQGFAYLLVFREFDDDQKDVILDFLENTPGFRDLSELKNTPGYLEVEVFSDEESSRLRRLVRAGLKDKGLELRTQAVSRNRMVFTNARSETQ